MMDVEPSFRVRNFLTVSQTDELMRFYANEWWTGDRTRSDVERMLAETGLLYALIDDSDALVAFARVLTDGTYLALLLDVVVAPEHRGQGRGRALLEHICSDPALRDVASIELVCQPEQMPFYGRFGFSENVGRSRLMRRTARADLLGPSSGATSPADGMQSARRRNENDTSHEPFSSG